MFLSVFSFVNTDNSQESRENRQQFLSTISTYTSSTYELLDIYLQFCIGDDYLLFSSNYQTLAR